MKFISSKLVSKIFFCLEQETTFRHQYENELLMKNTKTCWQPLLFARLTFLKIPTLSSVISNLGFSILISCIFGLNFLTKIACDSRVKMIWFGKEQL